MGRLSKRDSVLDAADALFEKQGFVATGINQITEEADVASMTLYNNFRNKEELMLATLERRSERFFDNLELGMKKVGDDPVRRILAIFDVIDMWIKKELKAKGDFAGCTFVKASIEFGEQCHPAHGIAADHKSKIIDLFAANARKAGLDKPKELALSLHLLVDGAITQAQVLGDSRSVRRAKAIAEKLLA